MPQPYRLWVDDTGDIIVLWDVDSDHTSTISIIPTPARSRIASSDLPRYTEDAHEWVHQEPEGA